MNGLKLSGGSISKVRFASNHWVRYGRWTWTVQASGELQIQPEKHRDSRIFVAKWQEQEIVGKDAATRRRFNLQNTILELEVNWRFLTTTLYSSKRLGDAVKAFRAHFAIFREGPTETSRDRRVPDPGSGKRGKVSGHWESTSGWREEVALKWNGVAWKRDGSIEI